MYVAIHILTRGQNNDFYNLFSVQLYCNEFDTKILNTENIPR